MRAYITLRNDAILVYLSMNTDLDKPDYEVRSAEDWTLVLAMLKAAGVYHMSCSSSMDFPMDETDDVALQDLARTIRAGRV